MIVATPSNHFQDKLVKYKWEMVGGFSKVVAIFNHVGGSFNLVMVTTEDVWMIPSFRISDYVLHVEHVSCHHELWPNEWAIPCPLSIVLEALLEENTTGKITIPDFRLVLKKLLYQVAYIIFCCSRFSLLSSVWFVITVCGSVSVKELVK